MRKNERPERPAKQINANVQAPPATSNNLVKKNRLVIRLRDVFLGILVLFTHFDLILMEEIQFWELNLFVRLFGLNPLLVQEQIL